jgi:hypothetical protein
VCLENGPMISTVIAGSWHGNLRTLLPEGDSRHARRLGMAQAFPDAP